LPRSLETTLPSDNRTNLASGIGASPNSLLTTITIALNKSNVKHEVNNKMIKEFRVNNDIVNTYPSLSGKINGINHILNNEDTVPQQDKEQIANYLSNKKGATLISKNLLDPRACIHAAGYFLFEDEGKKERYHNLLNSDQKIVVKNIIRSLSKGRDYTF
jgi:hypothetical protein